MKSLLGMHRVMAKSQRNMKQVLALLMIAYAVGLLIGEKLHDQLAHSAGKWNRYSELFLYLKNPLGFPAWDFKQAIFDALGSFTTLWCALSQLMSELRCRGLTSELIVCYTSFHKTFEFPLEERGG